MSIQSCVDCKYRSNLKVCKTCVTTTWTDNWLRTNFVKREIKNKMKTTSLLLVILAFTLCSSKPVTKSKLVTKPVVVDSIYVQVDLNDYLGFIDKNTDWNYTESDEYCDSILKANKVIYKNEKWVKKVSLKQFLNK